jgi:hypothetical protein
MPDSTITQLPSASAAADSVVPADNFDGTVTSKVTLGSIAALGGGPPASHASSHASAGSDPITPASIGAVATNDSRLTNSRAPTAHASTHATGQSDAIAPADIGAAAASHTHTLSAVTDAGTAASRNAPASGNATSSQVVLGSDTRLSDSRDPNAHASSHRSTGADYPAPVPVSPSLTTNQNDWAPGVADVYFVTSTGNVTITGLVANANNGFSTTIINTNASGGSTITLSHESSSSTAANRFTSPFGSNVILYGGGGSATLVYHAASSRWRIL